MEYSIQYEAYIKNEKDLYYNKDKFTSKQTNLCFITGLSGSGKSTMARAVNKNEKDIEHVDMDNFIVHSYELDWYKKNQPSVYDFFKGPGKELFEMKQSIGGKSSAYGEYNRKVTVAFVNYIISYAKSHKGKRYIVEGTYIFRFINPATLKDYAVFVKGTSAVESMKRAYKRDTKKDSVNYVDRSKQSFISKIAKGIDSAKTRWIDREPQIQKYRDYFIKAESQNKKEAKRLDASKAATELASKISENINAKGYPSTASSNIITVDFSEKINAILAKKENPSSSDRAEAFKKVSKQSVNSTNDAIMKTFDSDGELWYRCDAQFKYTDDISNGKMRIAVSAHLNKGEFTTVNGMPLNEFQAVLMYENDLIKLERFAGDEFKNFAMNNKRYSKSCRNQLHEFLKEFVFVDDDIYFNENVNYCAEEVLEYLNIANNTLKELEESCKEISSSHTLINEGLHVPFIDLSNLGANKLYTKLAPTEFEQAISEIKPYYINMVQSIDQSKAASHRIYTPGWDRNDWPMEPEEFFDKNCKTVYSTTYSGKKYGQISIVICEVDGDNKDTFIEALRNKFIDMIPEKYKMGSLKYNRPGFFITVVDKGKGTKAICLNSNFFLWR